jgi:hypothetical protein
MYKILRSTVFDGKFVDVGEVLELPKATARLFLAIGMAEDYIPEGKKRDIEAVKGKNPAKELDAIVKEIEQKEITLDFDDKKDKEVKKWPKR